MIGSPSRPRRSLSLWLGLLALSICWAGRLAADEPLGAARPNIIVILTDDQGYGDMKCHGHPFLKTPSLDRLHGESVRFTDWTVSPTCSPTRSALLTGRHEFHNGITHTIWERERLDLRATTIAQVLKGAGYATSIFGKWHLGDEAPYQPEKRGFDEVFIHGAGGIGQSYQGSCGDAPRNRYFDPLILHNGKFETTEGFCTDVFFKRAMDWIESRVDAQDGRPFFCWLSTNAPHAPLHCPDAWAEPYRAQAGAEANFFGMIANIDANVGYLLTLLKRRGLEENTLVVFLNDNGTAHGDKHYNAGMREKKGSPHRGGTRGASFWRWPGTLEPGDCAAITAHLDLFPTLCEIARVEAPAEVRARLEGFSLVPLLKSPATDWPKASQRERILFTHVGRWQEGTPPAKFGRCSVRQGRYLYLPRQVGGELYDLADDPGEKRDIAAHHSDIVERLRGAYDDWWDETLPQLVNEEAFKTAPKWNAFHELYWRQFPDGGPHESFRP